jgi:diguanylate cyclase (GGDEF)-like protein/PAS domain S-box-containing protein
MNKSTSSLRDLISKDIIWATPTESLSAIAQKLAANHASSVLISASEHHSHSPLGIFTLRDLINVMHRGVPDTTPVSDVMSKPVILINVQESFENALALLLKNGVRHLVVADEQNEVLGLISEADFKKYQQLSVISGLIDIKNLINTNVTRLAADDLLDDAINFLDHGVSSFVVVCDDEYPIGILSEAEVAVCFTRKSRNEKVYLHEVMSVPEIYSIDHSASAIIEHLVSIDSECLVLVDENGHFVGVLTLHNLLQPIQHMFLHQENSRLMTTLEDNEKRWLMALDGAGHGVWDWDGRFNSIYLSDQWKRNLGYAPSEFLDSLDAWLSHIHPDDVERVTHDLKAHFAGKLRHFKAIYRIKSRSGDHLWMLDQSTIFSKDMQGRPLRIVGTQTNITQMKEATKALELAEAYQRVLIDSFPFPVWLKDVQGHILTSNQDTLREDKTGGAIWSYLKSDSHSPLDEVALLGDQPIHQESVYAIDSEHHSHWLEAYSSPVFKDDGVVGTVGFARDITERNAFEASLRQSLNGFKALFDSVSDLIFVINRSGTILATNQYAKTRLGLDETTSLCGKHLSILHSSDKQHFSNVLADLINQPLKVSTIPLITKTQELFNTESHVVSGQWEGKSAFYYISRDLTDLQEAKETFASAFELSPVSMVLSDAETLRYLDVNKAFVERSGFSKEEVIGQTVLEMDFFESPDQRDELLQLLSKNSSVYNYKVQLRDKLGQAHFCLFSSEHMRLANRAVRLTVIQDLTEHLRTEAELRSERDLFTGGPVCVLIWKPTVNWDIQYASQNSERILGYTPSQLMGSMDYVDCIHPDDVDRVRDEVRGYYASDKNGWEQRYRIIKENGDVAWLYDYTQAERDASGTVVLLRGYVIDETRRVKSEESIRLSAKVFDHAHEGIMITDANQVVLDVNPTFTEITGFTRDEMLGRTPSLLRSGQQNDTFYNTLWEEVSYGGYWRGEIKNRHKDGSLYTALMTISSVYNDNQELTHYISVFSDISQLKEHQIKLERLAHYDALTQLPNRVLFSERLSQLMAITKRQHKNMAVCFLDLDHFKPVNDEMGHDVGDALLVEVSRRLKSVLREEDTVARLGGDEFAILLADLSSLEECDITLQRILYSIELPFEIKNRQFILSASIGVAWYPEDMADADSLIRHADQAMYQAKMNGRNRYHIYDAWSEVQSRTHLNTIKRIGQGVARGEFELYYQPQVNLREGAVLGVEALIRWNHPEKGVLAPAHFLPIISDCDTAVDLDHWVMNAALQALRAWQSEGLFINVSINLSGQTLLRPDFLRHIKELMRTYSDISPMYIELEVLETTALEDINQAEKVFAECQRMGFSIALDDFGTGYSSLTYFRRLPVNTLKIDQSFIRDMLDDPEDMAIVESVIGLGKAFGRHLVAEGVESVAHGQVLMDLGCDIAQGYGIAKPMRADKIRDWVKNWSASEFKLIETPAIFPLESRVLISAELEHSRWVGRIEAYINQEFSNLPRPDSMDEQICRFGRWYYGFGRSNYGTLPAFKKIEPCHTAIHNLAVILIQLCRDGDRAQARLRLKELTALSAQLHELLDELRDQITRKGH